ncbi:glycosyltransferase [Paenibacillus tarimensis]
MNELWTKGREAGYKAGYANGYHFGRCEAVLSKEMRPEQILWEKKVLFVKADGQPYSSIDEGISEGLSRLVRTVLIIRPGEDAASVAERERPDLVLVLDAGGRPFPVDQADRMRAAGLKTAVWFPDDPYHSDSTLSIAAHYDYVFTQELSCVPHYRKTGCPNVSYLPFAVNPKFTFPRRAGTSYQYDICFIGSAFWNRVAAFDEISEYLKGRSVFINGFWWERLRNYRILGDKINRYWLSPEETYRYYSNAKIVINLHRSPGNEVHNSNRRNIPAVSVNPRLFEISACGTLQLTDVRSELASFYAPGSDLDVFSSTKELIHKLDYYLNHEEERRQIAFNGLVRTVREHTYRRRLQKLLYHVWEE